MVPVAFLALCIPDGPFQIGRVVRAEDSIFEKRIDIDCTITTGI